MFGMFAHICLIHYLSHPQADGIGGFKATATCIFILASKVVERYRARGRAATYRIVSDTEHFLQ